MEYLYTVLKDHAIITLIDGQVRSCDPVKEVMRLKPDLVLITSLITNVNMVLKMAAGIKKLKSPPKIFIGGPHAEVLPQHFFTPEIDGVFYNNQLHAIEQVVKAIRSGEEYYHIAGTAFQKNGHFMINRPDKVNFNDFPIPERPLLRKYKNKYNLFYFNDCASIKTSFGCPEKCTFCFCRKMNQEEYGRRPLASVLQEIESIPNKNVFIVDDNFLLSPTYLEAFCESIKEKKITKQFIVYGTSRFIANHPELMKKLREAGLLAILVGLEFISDEALNAVHKGSDYADNETCIRVCQELDIELIGLFMLDPNWPASEFKKLMNYIHNRKIYLATFATLTVLPGTDLWEIKEKGNPDINNLWRYDFLRLHESPRYMSRYQYYFWMMYLYFRLIFRLNGFTYFKQRTGLWNTLKMSINGITSVFNFIIKIIIWP
ncbi:MAG: radical SAM protein [Saprospiraceae bacterium]|nr:radical SAM protein [Saprospiraceae bacterium]MBK8371835.1 radical SAM protein [Saprospiraceae bacterium]